MPGELILVVEDNDNNRMLVRDVLQASGYRVVEAENAEDGLRVAAEQQPALRPETTPRGVFGAMNLNVLVVVNMYPAKRRRTTSSDS